ncbi:hypothetical protein L1987_60812 [Smallanthus sonchifolius]|uniref:Uncharacterized protein n=1 Tax=Smallanthus sonchifolius TaxID=185202 RepID=A0ACB9D917_9ASTR|nr:hypothetical protein L1987_60812 [Smallanthus sonchifolius]
MRRLYHLLYTWDAIPGWGLSDSRSSCDDGNSRISIRVEEKIEKEWVVCDSEKDEDPVKVSEEVDFGYVDGELEGEGVIKDPESVSGVDACQVFDEMPERTELNDDGVDLVKSDEGNVLDEEDSVFDDDWQGILTTESEKSFGAAVAFVDSKGSADRVNLIVNEVKVQFYGLHRVAIEGSCFEPQPMALKVSKKLINAREQYIALLSQHVPDWMGRHASVLVDLDTDMCTYDCFLMVSETRIYDY